MGASANTDVELRLSAVTENFKTEMRDSARELRTWDKGINEVSGSMVDFTRISGSIGEIFEGVRKGNYGEMFIGIGGSVKELAMGVPAMAAGFRTAIGMMEGIAPLAIQIAGAALPIAALAAAVYMGVEAWKSYKEAQQAVVNMGKSLDETLKPVAENLESTRKRVRDLTDELAVLGDSPASQKIIKANAEYARASQAYFGNMNLYDEQLGRVAEAEGENLSLELNSLKFLEDKIKLEREQMAASRDEVDVLEKMAKAQRNLEAAQKWREHVKTFGDWAGVGQVPMRVETNQGIDTSVHNEVQRALAELNTGATDRINASLKRIDEAAREAAEDYVSSLGHAQTAFDDVLDGAYNLAASTFGPQLVSDVVDFTSKIGDAMSGAIAGVAGDMASAMGDMGKLLKNTAQGFSQGGFIGGIVGFVSTIAMSSNAFKEQTAYLNVIFTKIVGAFEPLFAAAGPVIETVGELVSILSNVFGVALRGFGTVAKWTGQIIATVGYGIGTVFKLLAQAWNGIVSAIQWVLRELSNIPFLGSLSDWADKMDSWKADIDGIDDALDGMHEAMKGNNTAINDAADANNSLAQAAQSAAEQLTNIPQGYKVALTRFNAIGVSGNQSLAQGSGGAYSSNSVTIQQLTVVSSDPAKMLDGIQKEAARRNLVRTGTRLASMGTPYSTVPVGAR
jgi:hypothetical protein